MILREDLRMSVRALLGRPAESLLLALGLFTDEDMRGREPVLGVDATDQCQKGRTIEK